MTHPIVRSWRIPLGLAAAFVSLAVLAGPARADVTLSPAADAYVRSDASSSNFGTTKELRARGGGGLVIDSYLKFVVAGAGSISSARLRLFVTDPSSGTASVFLVPDSSWTESGITYANAPAPIGAALDSEPNTGATGVWVELDVGSAITGDGTYTLLVANNVSDAVFYSSRQGANPPQLVVSAGAVAPTAAFAANPTSGTAPLAVSFSDQSTGGPTSWAWNFGDPASGSANTSTLQNPAHTYAAAGTYTVTLTATNAQGSDGETKTAYISVGAPSGPTAAFVGSPTSGTAPLAVSFSDQSTGGPTSWAWNFGDPASGSANTSTLQNPAHTYAAAGTYTVTLTATNAQGSDGETKTGYISVTSSAGGGTVTLYAAGDIACDPASSSFNGGNGTSSRCRQKATSDLVLAGSPDAVLPLGDLQYEDATLAGFQQSYNPSWGRFFGITYPVTGNHEYQTAGAAGYFGYWGAKAHPETEGYYSFDLGSWHVVVLNSNCSQAGGCGAGSGQEQWLRADLAAHPATCTIAAWHHPLFNGTKTGTIKTNGATRPLWQALFDFNADVVLNGHVHHYERFAPQTPSGAPDPVNGIREFIVGTGGIEKGGSASPVGTLQVVAKTFGVLRLQLSPTSYDWQFQPAPGESFTDAGSTGCH